MLNKICIQGRLVHTPELRRTGGGTAVLNADLACSRSRKDADGNYPTDFFPVVFWGKTAELVAQHCGKGDMILTSGSMQQHKYTDKDGNNRTAWELQADGFEFCQRAKDHADKPVADTAPAQSDPFDLDASDDRPF